MAVEREVIYRIRYEVDPRNAQAMQDLANQANQHQQRLAQTQQQAAADRSRQILAEHTRQNEAMARVTEEQTRRRVETERNALQTIDDHQRRVATAYQDVLRRVTAESHEEMNRGARRALQGLHELGRGLVVLKAVNEDTAESALRVVGTFTAMVDLGRGIYDTFTGLSRAMEAYTIWANRAAVAQTVLNTAMATQGAAGAAGGGGGGGGTGGALANGAGAYIAGGGRIWGGPQFFSRMAAFNTTPRQLNERVATLNRWGTAHDLAIDRAIATDVAPGLGTSIRGTAARVAYSPVGAAMYGLTGLAGTAAGAIGIPAAGILGGVALNRSLTEYWTAPGTDMRAGGFGSLFGGLVVGSGGYGWESGDGFAGANAMLERNFARDDMGRIGAESDVARAAAIGGIRANSDAAIAGVSGMTNQQMIAQRTAAVQSRITSASGRFGAAQSSSELAGTSLVRQAGAARDEVQAREELVRLTQQQYTIEMDRINATRMASDQAIKNAKTLADSFRAIRDMELDRVKTAEQRFGSLDPMQRQGVLRAAKRAAAGGELSEQDSLLLDEFRGLGNLGGAIDRSRSARAKRGGFDELSRLTGADQRVAAAQFFATDASVGARSVIQTASEIRVKLDADAKSLGVQIADELRKQFQELEAAMVKRLETERRQREQERNVSAAKKRAAAGG